MKEISQNNSAVNSVFSKKNRIRDKFVVIICLFAIFAQQIFFSMSGLIGYKYGGREESPIYIQYIVLIFIATCVMYALSYIKRPKISKVEIGFCFFFTLLVASHLVWWGLDGGKTYLLTKNLIFFFSLGFTGFMASRIIYAYDKWYELIKLSELFFILISVGLIISIVLPYGRGLTETGIGGASNQAASYFSAMCFGMLGVATFRLKKGLRYKWFRGRTGLFVNISLMIALFIATIINGGRGAFILIFIFNSLIFYWIANKNGLSRRGVVRYVVVAISLPIIISSTLQILLDDPVLSSGYRRATAFIGDRNRGLIDMEEGSSGRDVVYDIALKGIADSPLIGYGAFSNWEKVIQPHNLFLDLSLQFGVPIALILTISILVNLWRKIKPLTTEKVWILTLFLFPSVMLSFSGGYLQSAIFWFCLASYFFLDRKN